jgi:hypothetical protein
MTDTEATGTVGRGMGELDFDLAPDEFGPGRSAVINEGAAALDELGVKLGTGPDALTELAEIALELDQDEAELSLPDVLPLDLSKLPNDAPVRQNDLLAQWRFYWVSFPVHLWAKRGRGFNRIEFKVTFNGDEPEASRPRAHDAVPNPLYSQLAHAGGQFKLGVGAGLKFGVKTPSVDLSAAGIPAEAEAHVHSDIALDTEAVIGPFDYAIRVPTIQRSNLDLDKVIWRLEGARMVQEKDPGLRVVLKVPIGTEVLRMSAVLRAERFVNTFDGSFLEALKNIGDKFRMFVNRGAAIGDKQSWDLTNRL